MTTHTKTPSHGAGNAVPINPATGEPYFTIPATGFGSGWAGPLKPMYMTSSQFSALAKLLRVRIGSARQAASLVLVDGYTPSDAARLAGLSPASVSNAVTRFRRGLDLAKIAATRA